VKAQIEKASASDQRIQAASYLRPSAFICGSKPHRSIGAPWKSHGPAADSLAAGFDTGIVRA
jgi:hypothetical protein